MIKDTVTTEEFLDGLIDIANEAIDTMDNGGLDRSWLVSEIASHYAEARGIALAQVEREAIDASIKKMTPDDDELYYLCDAKTRRALPYHEPVRFIQYDIEYANEELEERGLVWIDSETLNTEHKEREAKRQAEAAAERERNRRYLNDEEREALHAYARENGRTWKAKLRQSWENGTATEALQRLRNASYFGPSGLQKFKLPTFSNAKHSYAS